MAQTLMAISMMMIAVILVVAVICVIPVLMQIRRTAREVEKTLETARMQIVPLSHNLTSLSQETHGILKSVHRQVENVEGSLETLRDAADRLRNFEETILDRIEGPLLGLTSVFSAVLQGVGVFFRTLLR